jgi:hypothetical protein
MLRKPRQAADSRHEHLLADPTSGTIDDVEREAWGAREPHDSEARPVARTPLRACGTSRFNMLIQKYKTDLYDLAALDRVVSLSSAALRHPGSGG